MRRVGSSRSSSVWRHLISITDEIVGGQRTKEISKGKIRYAEITAKEIPKRERNPKEGIGSAEFEIRGNRKPQPTSPLTAIFTRVPRLSDLTWCYTPVLPRCPPGVIHRCPPLTSVLHFVIRHFCLDHLGLKSPTSSPVRVPNLCQSVSRRVLLRPLPLDLRSRNFTLRCSLTSVSHFVIRHFCLDHLGFEVAHFFACQSAEPLSVCFTSRTPAPITSGPEIA